MDDQNHTINALIIEQAMEKLRQEQETFNQQKLHENRWFSLRLGMGYASIILLISIMSITSFILINNTDFPNAVVVSAGGALFVDVLGLLVGVWKIALNPNYMTKLSPVTQFDIADNKLILDKLNSSINVLKEIDS